MDHDTDNGGGRNGEHPVLRTAVPGPRSLELARRLAQVESANVTAVADDWPVFLAAGDGAFLIDADSNRLLDMTGCFGVASCGYGPTSAAAAGGEQLARLACGMGDVHPTQAKVELLERLAKLAPFRNARTILGCNGSDAVEAAFKTVKLTTGRPGVVSFTAGYHGLSYGALAGTAWPVFREPFADQLPWWGFAAPYPDPYRLGPSASEQATGGVEAILSSARGSTIGAVIVEPIQGRGGVVVPPDDFLPALRRLCDRRGLLLIADEIYCGLGRTGRLWACDHVNTAPDILLVGKSLGGGLPVSACAGNERAMSGWPKSDGEAIHTHTFLGHPVGCAMACAALDELVSQDLAERAARLGRHLLGELARRLARFGCVGDIRGRGLMVGVELVTDRETKGPAGPLAGAAVKAALRRGLLILSGGTEGNVLTFTPPLTVTEGQLDAAVGILADSLAESWPTN